MKRSILVVLTWFIATSVWAHTTIEGKVINSQTQEPLVGASIMVKGTETGTTTDRFGNFRLKSDQEAITLVVSYVGFDMQELTISEPNKELIVSLKPGVLALEQVSVSASQQNSLNTLSKIDVNLRPVTSSQQVLRYVPGLFIAQHAGGGKAEQIFLRGFDIDHGTDISISVDGKPVNMVSHAHGQGYADLHFVIPELIEAVDFGKGPYYSEQGNFNTAGYVNFQTKNSLEHSTIKVEGGQFNSVRTLAMIDLLGNKETNGTESAYIAGEFVLTDGPFESPQNFSRYNVFAKYSKYINPNKLLSLQASTFRSEWDHSGQIPVRAVEQGLISRFGAIDDTEGGITGRTDISAKLIDRFSDNTHIENHLYYTFYDFQLFSNFTFFLDDPLNGDQIMQKEERQMAGYQSTLFNQADLWGMPLHTKAGVGFRNDRVEGNELSHTKNRRQRLDSIALGDVVETNMFAFVDETLQFGKFSLNAGLRLDYFKFNYIDALQTQFERQSVSKTTISPKLNLHYNLTPNTQFFVKSGIGFHSNDTRVVVAQNGRDILPQAYGVDVGTTFKPYNKLLLSAAAWYLYLEQEFVYVGDAGIVEPSGETERKGIDFSARYEVLPWLFVDADVNLTEPRSLEANEGENYIPLAPTFSGTGGLSVQHSSGINGSVRVRYLGDRPANEDYSTTAEGYTVADASINYTRKKWEIGVMVENIFDVDWREAQFDTESRLQDEPAPVTEVHFTPGTPFFLRGKFSIFF